MNFGVVINDKNDKQELTLRSFSNFLLGDRSISGRYIETQRRLVDLADKSGYTFTESDLSRALSKTTINKKALANIKEKIIAQLKSFSIGLAKEILKVRSNEEEHHTIDSYNLLLEKQIIDSFCVCLEKVFVLPSMVAQNISNYREVEAHTTETVELLSQIIASILAYTCTPRNYCASSEIKDENRICIDNSGVIKIDDTIHTLEGGTFPKSYLDSMIKTLLCYEKDIYISYDYRKVNIHVNEETGTVERDIEVKQKLNNPSRVETCFEISLIYHNQLPIEELMPKKFDNFKVSINDLDFIDYLKKHRTKMGDDMLRKYESDINNSYSCFFKSKHINSIKNVLKTRRFIMQIPIPNYLEEIVLKYNTTSYSNPSADSLGYAHRQIYPCQRLFHEYNLKDSPNWILMGFVFPLVVGSRSEAQHTNLSHYGPNRENCTIDIPLWQPPGFGYMIRVKNKHSCSINNLNLCT